MSVFTLCFVGTDCWPDESCKDRSDSGGSSPALYGNAGYIPARIFSELCVPPSRKAVIPGVGPAYSAYWRNLWVPSTTPLPEATIPIVDVKLDSVVGRSMWDLAGHAAAKVVGIPSSGRGTPDSEELNDPEVIEILTQTELLLGARLQGNHRTQHNAAPYLFSHQKLEVLNTSAHATDGGGPITKINMIGHSRGAVEAIMCSHDLAVLFPNAEVNIFAIDPVPGLGLWDPAMTTLGTTVKNYVGVYSLDEVSNGFNAVVPQPFYQKANLDPLKHVQDKSEQWEVPYYHLVYSPGRHGTVSGNRASDGASDLSKFRDEAAAVGLLISRLARTCLRRWGTLVPPSLPKAATVTDLKIIVDSNAAVYRRMRQYHYPSQASIFHYPEHGISSKSGVDFSDWSYLEDIIGDEPLVPRDKETIDVRDARPGQIKWWKLQDIPDHCFKYTDLDIDRQWSESSTT